MKAIFTLFLAITIGLVGCNSKKSTTDQPVKDSLTVAKPLENEPAIIQEQPQPDSTKGSIHSQAVGKSGNTEIKIDYYSPAVRGRIIWGGLVPFDKVWVTGAHSATSIEFNTDLTIGDKIIPAGKYAFFTIPGKEEWTMILNKNWKQHLTDQYDEKEDVVRVKVKPETEDKNQERLRYVIEMDSDKEGEIVVYWEKLEISVGFRVK